MACKFLDFLSRKISCGALVGVLSGCAYYLDFDKVLNSCIGQKIEDIKYPSIEYIDKIHPSTVRFSINYAMSLCKWTFYLAEDNSTVLGWKYLDEKSKYYCHGVPRAEP